MHACFHMYCCSYCIQRPGLSLIGYFYKISEIELQFKMGSRELLLHKELKYNYNCYANISNKLTFYKNVLWVADR